LGAVLSKKASQLLRLLSDGSNSVDAADLESSAAMLSAAKALISSLDRLVNIVEITNVIEIVRNNNNEYSKYVINSKYDRNNIANMIEIEYAVNTIEIVIWCILVS